MSERQETVEDIVREARDKYTVHKCNECNWRKSCMGRKFGDSECVNERQSISLAFGIEDGYFAGLLNRIESAWRREKAELERKVADALTTGAFVAEASARKPKRNCDTVSDFNDAKRKFKDENTKGRAKYCRRLCHWLLAPVAKGGES